MRAKPGITAGEWLDRRCDSKRLWGPKGSWKVTPTTHATSLKERRLWGGERERKAFPSGESLPASSKHHLVKGAFPSQGGVDDEISLGAYVAAALLELGQPLKVSMSCSLLLSGMLPRLGTAMGICQLVMLAFSRPGTGRELRGGSQCLAKL